MTRPPGESLPNQHEIVDSPAQLPGLEPLEVGHSVEITRLGMEIEGASAEDVVTILVGQYEGRAANGAPFPYGENPNVNAVRILDISALPITVRTRETLVPSKLNFASFRWDASAGYTPKPLLTPLFPGVEYAVKDLAGSGAAAKYTVSEEGALTVIRSVDVPVEGADVRVMGFTPNDDVYVPRPARVPVKPGAAAVADTVILGQGTTRIDRDGHVVVETGTFRADSASGFVITNVGKPFIVSFGEPGVFEAYSAHVLARKQEAATHGAKTVDDFTTIGKEGDTGGQPIVP